MRIILSVLMVFTLASCAGVRKEDVEAWEGQPVAKLDTHWLFLTMEMEKRQGADGIETRNYKNKDGAVSSLRCFFGNCSLVSSQAVCNNLFYIKDGTVIGFNPVGKCKTDESVRPVPSSADNRLPAWVD